MKTKFLAFTMLIASYAVANNLDQAKAQLHQAILNNSATEVQQVITSGSTQGRGNETAEWFLIKAILNGNLAEIEQAAKQLINEGKNGNSPILWAALLKKPNAVKVLLDCGAKLDANFVKYAIKVKDLNTALILIRGGVDISDIMQECVGLCLLHYRTLDINIVIEFVQELIERGYDVNNALSYANIYHDSCYGGKLLEFLIQNGANPNHVIEKMHLKGATPLVLAIDMKAKKAINILLNAGADINKKAKNRSNYSEPVTPLYMATNLNPDSNIIELLLEHGAQY